MSRWPKPVLANVIRAARAPRLEWLAQVLGPPSLSTDSAEKGQEAMLRVGHARREWRGLLWKLQPGVCIVARLWENLRNRFDANGMGCEGRRWNDYKCTGEACDCDLIRVQNRTVGYNKDFPTWETLEGPAEKPHYLTQSKPVVQVQTLYLNLPQRYNSRIINT